MLAAGIALSLFLKVVLVMPLLHYPQQQGKFIVFPASTLSPNAHITLIINTFGSFFKQLLLQERGNVKIFLFPVYTTLSDTENLTEVMFN